MDKKVIIIPTYNEKENIEKIIRKVFTLPEGFHILVIDDGSPDGTADIVKMYFGEYKDDKYQFMLKTMMKEEGSENFIAASILPFAYDKDKNTWCWDKSPLGENKLCGEERLKECYRIIKAANDKRPGSRKFDIPEVVLE